MTQPPEHVTLTSEEGEALIDRVYAAIGKERCNIADGVSNALICRDLLKRKSA